MDRNQIFTDDKKIGSELEIEGGSAAAGIVYDQRAVEINLAIIIKVKGPAGRGWLRRKNENMAKPDLAWGGGALIAVLPDVVSRTEGVLPSSGVRVIKADGGVPSHRRSGACHAPVAIGKDVGYRSHDRTRQHHKSGNESKRS